MQVLSSIFGVSPESVGEYQHKVTALLRKELLSNGSAYADQIAGLFHEEMQRLVPNGKRTLDLNDLQNCLFWSMSEALFGPMFRSEANPQMLQCFLDIDNNFGAALRKPGLPVVRKPVNEVTKVIEQWISKHLADDSFPVGPIVKFYLSVLPGVSADDVARFCVAAWWGGLGNTLPSFLWSLIFLVEYKEGNPDFADADLVNDEFLSMVFSETLRLTTYSVAWRQTINDVVIQGQKVPKNTLIGLHFCIEHFRKSTYANPHTFDPERFRNYKSNNKYTFVPFSAGRHKCSGYPLATIEVPAVLKILFSNYKVQKSAAAKKTHFVPRFNFSQSFGVVGPQEQELSLLKLHRTVGSHIEQKTESFVITLDQVMIEGNVIHKRPMSKNISSIDPVKKNGLSFEDMERAKRKKFSILLLDTDLVLIKLIMTMMEKMNVHVNVSSKYLKSLVLALSVEEAKAIMALKATDMFDAVVVIPKNHSRICFEPYREFSEYICKAPYKIPMLGVYFDLEARTQEPGYYIHGIIPRGLDEKGFKDTLFEWRLTAMMWRNIAESVEAIEGTRAAQGILSSELCFRTKAGKE
eukprot:augustus_masked-scaffold_1-processed-gene-28.39-mRNA-1 protein AED:1.00 eAED:1.00 QI:0/0/0/0/1/1/3/0/578